VQKWAKTKKFKCVSTFQFGSDEIKALGKQTRQMLHLSFRSEKLKRIANKERCLMKLSNKGQEQPFAESASHVADP